MANKIRLRQVLLHTVLILLANISGISNQVISLGKLNIHQDAVTVSGFSSGASMATQLHVAHSSLFYGAGLFSQVFYRCGPNSLVEFGIRCSKIGLGIFPYNVRNSVRDAQMYESQGLIDPLENLENQRVFILTGTLDEYVPPELAVQNVGFYKTFISNPNTSISLTVLRAKHLFPTTNFGAGCDQDASKNVYLGNCNYSGAYHSLEFLLRDKATLIYPPESMELRPLLKYNQSEFYQGNNIHEIAMGTEGFIYIPTRCKETRKLDGNQRVSDQKCFLHLNFHGCNEWPPAVAEVYIRNSGFLSVAEANDIIMVFPLSTKVPQNMDGCWDFYSYTGNNFATNQGSQIKVARAIIQRLLTGI